MNLSPDLNAPISFFLAKRGFVIEQEDYLAIGLDDLIQSGFQTGSNGRSASLFSAPAIARLLCSKHVSMKLRKDNDGYNGHCESNCLLHWFCLSTSAKNDSKIEARRIIKQDLGSLERR